MNDFSGTIKETSWCHVPEGEFELDLFNAFQIGARISYYAKTGSGGRFYLYASNESSSFLKFDAADFPEDLAITTQEGLVITRGRIMNDDDIIDVPCTEIVAVENRVCAVAKLTLEEAKLLAQTAKDFLIEQDEKVKSLAQQIVDDPTQLEFVIEGLRTAQKAIAKTENIMLSIKRKAEADISAKKIRAAMRGDDFFGGIFNE